MTTFEARLMEFVRRELVGPGVGPIDEETYLFDEGLVDSLKILQLIAFIEMQTGHEIPDRDVVMANFRTVRTIARRFGAGAS
jgi:acyl carrier protein